MVISAVKGIFFDENPFLFYRFNGVYGKMCSKML